MNFSPRTISLKSSKLAAIDWAAVQAVLTAFISTRFMLLLVILLSSTVIPIQTGTGFLYADPDNVVVDGLVRFDSWWYHNIVTQGYNLGNIETGQQGNVAFFPLYPTLIKAAMFLTGDIFRAGLLVSNTAFLIALSYLYALTKQEFDADVAARTVFYFAAAPTAIFFSAMYTESIYLAFTIATFYYVRQRHYFGAALTGALAAATRNTGIVLSGVIVLEGLHQTGFWSARGKALFQAIWRNWYAILAGSFVLMGLFGYMIYLTTEFGDPIAFITVQATWGRDVSSAGLTKIISNTGRELNLENLLRGQFNPIIFFDLLFTLLFIPLIIAVGRNLRLAHFAFVGLTFLVPLTTGTVSSMSRYVLMLFPCFMILGLWGKHKWFDRLVLTISLPLMAYSAILFSHWYFAG